MAVVSIVVVRVGVRVRVVGGGGGRGIPWVVAAAAARVIIVVVVAGAPRVIEGVPVMSVLVAVRIRGLVLVVGVGIVRRLAIFVRVSLRAGRLSVVVRVPIA